MLGEDDHDDVNNEPINAEDLFGDGFPEDSIEGNVENNNENEEAQASNKTDDQAATKKQRQNNRLANLNENWLVNPKKENIRKVNSYFEKIKFRKGKGQERENLKMILQRYEYFGQQCYPKLCFKDFVEKVEYVSGKKTIKHVLQEIRQGLKEGNSIESDNEEDAVIAEVQDPEIPSPSTSPAKSPTRPSSPPSKALVMTDEMRQVIRKKREEAIAKRKQRLDDTLESSQNDISSQNEELDNKQNKNNDASENMDIDREELVVQENQPVNDKNVDFPENGEIERSSDADDVDDSEVPISNIED